MVIVKKAAVIDLLLSRSDRIDLEAFLQRLQESFKKQDNSPNVRSLIFQTCQNRLARRYELNLGLIAIAALAIDDQTLFADTISRVPQVSDEKESDEDDYDRDYFDEKGFNEKTFFALGELIYVPLPVILEQR